MTKPNQATRHTVYYPPEAGDIEEAAALLRQKMDRDSEFEDGFGGLLKAIAKAYAHHLTRHHEAERLDNDQQTA